MSREVAVHLNPVWRDRANFIAFASVELDEPAERWEQLWARQIADNVFEICCIPFFVYDLALGDHVETGPKREKQYVVQKVAVQSGHQTFRVSFSRTTQPGIAEEVLDKVEKLGCLFEWYSKRLLAIDVATETLAHEVGDFLCELEGRGLLKYETGRSK